jgi:hypothetical protein
MLAFIGALLGGVVNISIRTITKYAKLHFMVVPIGFSLGSVFLCPVFMMFRVCLTSIDPNSTVMPVA